MICYWDAAIEVHLEVATSALEQNTYQKTLAYNITDVLRCFRTTRCVPIQTKLRIDVKKRRGQPNSKLQYTTKS